MQLSMVGALGGTAGTVGNAIGSVGRAVGAASASGTAQTTPQSRLVKAAHEFEAQIMSELMKPMLRDTSITGDDDADSDSGAGSGGALNEFASETLGQALSAGGGFGIANRIIKQLSPSSNQNGNAPVTGMLHGNTVIKTLK